MTHDSCVGHKTQGTVWCLWIDLPHLQAGSVGLVRTFGAAILAGKIAGSLALIAVTSLGWEHGDCSTYFHHPSIESIVCESFRSIIVRRCIITAFTRAGTRCDMTNFHETNLPIYPIASKDLFWIWQASWRSSFMGSGYQGVSKKIEYPFSSHARKCSFATRCDSTQHFLKDYIIQVVKALNQIRPDVSFKLQFASSTFAVPLECIQPCCLEACRRQGSWRDGRDWWRDPELRFISFIAVKQAS